MENKNEISENIYEKSEKKVEQIIKKASLYMKGLNPLYISQEINKAYIYSRDAHEWQFRHSWEPYIIHPVEATEILLDLKPDIFTIQACLLHDVIEDTDREAIDIEKEFWKEVAFLCEWLAKLSKIKYKWQERDIWSLRKMFVAMAEDLRVIFVKLSDRLHNMRTLKYHPKKEKREKIALETLNIFTPIADRLWLYNLKNSLEEECFKILDPKRYKELKKELRDLEPQRKAFVKNVKKEIVDLLKWELTWFQVDYRVKSIYSIHKKLLKKELNHASDLFDIFGIRIIVNTEAECYKVLWIIHNNWTPLPKRFKDYIALPKPNWYKSLHTNVMWIFKADRKQPTEIQIKTYKMKEYSDIWVAAHFEYKEKWSVISTDVDWVKELKDLVDNLQDNDFVWSLKLDFFKDRIFVFTPKWDYVNLPSGSTPIDFAYSLHTDLWDHITIAKVNRAVYPLDRELHNWDVVEIIIDKNKKPNPFRISFVKTVKAKNRIKLSLKKEDKELHKERWREIMSKYLEKAWLWKFDKDLSVLKVLDSKTLSLDERYSLLEQVWNFSLPPSSLIKRVIKSLPDWKILNNDNKEEDEVVELLDDKTEEKIIKSNIVDNKNNKKNLIIWWETWLDYKLCYCSRRKLTNDIVAHINNRWSITIHRRNCKILESVNRDRLLSAYIDGENEDYLLVNIKLLVENKIWVLKNLSEIIFSMWINVEWINTKKIWNSQTEILLELSIFDYDYLLIDRFIERVKIYFKEKLLNLELWKIDKK